MVVAESIKFLAGTAFIARSAVLATYEYFKDEKATQNRKPKGTGLDKAHQLPEELPSAVDIKKKLPKQCFDPKVSTSMYYALKDAVLVALTYVLVLYLHAICPAWMYWPITVVYWGLQGTLFTAIFVIGHDCGHDSFSHHSLLNDTIGQIWHGFLICPFYMWKLSHRTHHKNNANIDKDEVYYPIKKSHKLSKGRVLPGFLFGFGWFGYLITGYSPRAVNHFNIYHKDFIGHTLGCLLSLVICSSWSFCLYLYAAHYGALAWFNYYFVPLFIFATYMVVITFLHHSEINIPWYSNDKWDFVRGQLSTIDRNYGIVHYMIHSIGTHQMHHMFTKIPHYHLEEATIHFRKNFPELVRKCDEPIMPSFMRMCRKFETQSVIDDDTQMHTYH
jgi:omega-3 fatty acid desaturase (delta-15 desaturase)